jgi:hypothetical protein
VLLAFPDNCTQLRLAGVLASLPPAAILVQPLQLPMPEAESAQLPMPEPESALLAIAPPASLGPPATELPVPQPQPSSASAAGPPKVSLADELQALGVKLDPSLADLLSVSLPIDTAGDAAASLDAMADKATRDEDSSSISSWSWAKELQKLGISRF